MDCCNSRLAFSNSSRFTNCGIMTACAGAKSAETQLIAKQIEQIRKRAADEDPGGTRVETASNRTSSARRTSLAIMIWSGWVRRGHRSANTPASGPITMAGTSETSNTALTSRADPRIRNTMADCTANIAR